jgi:hypothetical protein
VTLELSRLTEQVRTMGKTVSAREETYAKKVSLARAWLAAYADQSDKLQHPARAAGTAIPSDEPLDATWPLPPTPETFTVVAADGSQIQPDRHSAAFYYLINIGSLVYRHGSGEAPEALSEPQLGYKEEDLYESGRTVTGNLLDVRRDLAEITRLADVCTETTDTTIALADGSLILWVLENLSPGGRKQKVTDYLEQMERIQRSGNVLGGFISRPGYDEVVQLIRLASLDGDPQKAHQEPNPLEHLPDRAVFSNLPPGARSALFVSPKKINQSYYVPEGHEIYFFYLNLADEEHDPVIARLEAPAWIAKHTARLNLLHSAVVAQARITGDYPYALARADELAYISSQERAAFEDLVVTALLRAGVRSVPSPKAYYKQLTRRRTHRL